MPLPLVERLNDLYNHYKFFENASIHGFQKFSVEIYRETDLGYSSYPGVELCCEVIPF